MYGAMCQKDELLIIQSDSLQGAGVVPRQLSAELKDEDKKQLERLNLSTESWSDEGSIMKARMHKDSTYTVVGIERSRPGQPLSKKMILKKIQDMMKTTLKAGSKKVSVEYCMIKMNKYFTSYTLFSVGIHYHGPGQRNTGDWCFEDGYIGFRDIAEIYMQYFKGKVLIIVSDSSYSGLWVKHCAEFFDEHGIKPCAHFAKEKEILISVRASCRSYEIPHQRHFTLHGCGNDKNTGSLWYWNDGKELAADQHAKQANSLLIKCGNDLIDDHCKLGQDASWSKFVLSDRIFLVRGFDQQRPAWHYVLLVDDKETIHKFIELTMGANAGKNTTNMNDYGVVLKSGWGHDPPNDVKEWMKKNYDAS